MIMMMTMMSSYIDSSILPSLIDSSPALILHIFFIFFFFFQGILGQCLVIALPNSLKLCQDPPSDESLLEMDTLLLLLLGAAVQCNQKEQMVESIKNLPTEIQHAFMAKITDVSILNNHF